MQQTCLSEGYRLPRGLFTALLLTAALALSACGIGASGAEDDEGTALLSGGAHDLKITTLEVPEGSQGVAYEDTQLSATGATGPVTWTLAEGDLPPGMTLTEDGRVTGVPESIGYYQFTAQASDGRDADARTLGIAVETFGMTAVSGVFHGDAWSGNRVTLVCAGFEGSVEFEIASDDSRGTFESIDAEEGSAIYVPGPISGRTAVDLIRGRCTTSGATAEVSLRIVPDPSENHVARFGTSDVWFLSFTAKYGSHPYASDWHAALVEVGLRSPDAYQVDGSKADDLAELVTRLAVLRHINAMYLRNEDGSPGAQGLPISFPLEMPGPGYAMPAPGSWLNGRTYQFNVMSVCENQNAMVVGTAFVDSVGNPLQENNSPGGEVGMLGTFVNGICHLVKSAYRHHGTQLIENPVEAGDVDALRALLYGLPSVGGRREVLEYAANALGRSVAYIAAHEIGHSLGLTHSETTVGSIMNTGAAFGPFLEYSFLPDDLDVLRRGLPGPGRSGGAYEKFGPTLPEGGISVTEHAAVK